MKIINLLENSNVYTSNVFLILGDWNALKDVNTLVDAGADPQIFEIISGINTGVGKSRIEQVVLTHSHSDHTKMLSEIKNRYGAKVLAFSPSIKGVDHILKDNEKIIMGDMWFEVIHAPGHSSDSICLFCNDTGDLFVGDVPVIIRSSNGTHEHAFVKALERLTKKTVKNIHFGHGKSLIGGGRERLGISLKYVLTAQNISHSEDTLF